MLATLLSGTEPPIPIEKEAGWTLDSVWTFWRKGKSLAPARNQNQIIHPVA